MISRRKLLLTTAGLAIAAGAPAWSRQARAQMETRRLVAAPGSARLVPEPYPETPVWAYDETVPGPEIRVCQGERVEIVVENRLEEATSVHWHGIRLPNAMDGVPHLTQSPIEPGESFVYAFDCPDAGTFWYHPHLRSYEQVGRGLSGALVVEEAEPVAVDRDLVWLLDDWRLTPDAIISEDFGHFRDVSHAGRLGNTVTLNGRVPESFVVRRGERIRLRLINAANARIFGLSFEGHEPQVVAYDGQPVAPHAPAGGRLILGPGMRADVILDMAGHPGQQFMVIDSFYQGQEYRLLDLVYANEVVRDEPVAELLQLPANPLAEPDLVNAEYHEVVFGGGMMGGMGEARLNGHLRPMGEIMRRGLAWTVNGVVATGHDQEPILALDLGQSYIFALINETAWPHPIHLHGHAFRVISRDGEPTPHREWQDTVLLGPREKAEVAFVADNPGDWMLHCHVLEHQLGGMSGVIRVGGSA